MIRSSFLPVHIQSIRGTDGYVLVYARSPHRPTRRFLRIHGKTSLVQLYGIMPNNRSIGAHLLRPSAYADTGASKAFMEETHWHTQRERFVAKASSVPWNEVLVVSGTLFSITRPRDFPTAFALGSIPFLEPQAGSGEGMDSESMLRLV